MMDLFARETLPISLEEEMQRSYLDYAMSVIVGRALPDVRDGLKPVHRRVLYAMHELHNDWNRAYKKSARVVGDVIGKYHPHGDIAVYDTIVRMAQDFSLRYPLVDGQGNFGSVDGDNAAAMRYTEIRMAKITQELLSDIDKNTVNFGPNYDGSEKEPLILPTKLPNLLINGASGIAVGMATNIPPHNLSEVINGCVALLDDPTLSVEDLMQHIPAPDFPTAGFIYGVTGAKQGYLTGRGRIVMRARTHFEDLERGNRRAIIVDELPYQVNKATLCERIADLVRDKRVEGISTIRDESDKSGMRIVIELKRDANEQIILNQLYKETSLQESFSMNMVALVDGQPKLLNLKQILICFLRHRREVITRRTQFDLQKAKERGHLLEGLDIALQHVDQIVELVKGAPNPQQARDMLRQNYTLSDIQAQAILDLRLQRLTGLERDKILKEYEEVKAKIADLEHILISPDRVTAFIRQELLDVKTQFGDARRSELVFHTEELSREDFIAPEDRVITFTHGGYIKSQPLTEFKRQKRGGTGKKATSTKEDDFIEKVFIANTHDYILCFSNLGTLYWLKVYDIPEGSRISRGKPIVNLIPLSENEKINAILPIKTFDEGHYVFMATSKGIVKKTSLIEFSRPRTAGIRAISLDEDDYLINAAITDGQYDIMLFSSDGQCVRFIESEVRPMGRGAQGVIGMRLPEIERVISLVVSKDENHFVLIATENGLGKLTSIGEFTPHHRGTRGIRALKGNAEKAGRFVAAILVEKQDDIMLITDGGMLVRTEAEQISTFSRYALGVKLINLNEDQKLAGVVRIVDPDVENLPIADDENVVSPVPLLPELCEPEASE